MKTKEQRQAEYKERQRERSKQLLDAERRRKARAERDLMHRAAKIVTSRQEQEVILERSGVMPGLPTKVLQEGPSN